MIKRKIAAMLGMALGMVAISCTPTRVAAGGPGESFSTAIVMKLGAPGIIHAQEDDWMNANYPGYEILNRRRVHKDLKVYDIITAKISPSDIANFYFDISAIMTVRHFK